MRIATRVAISFLAATAAPSLAQAELIYGLTSNNSIVTFDSATPGSQLSSLAILGLGTDVLTGIDLRPATAQLYSLATNGNLYNLQLGGGVYNASLVGNIGVSVAAPGYGIDFNPTVDRLRFITSSDLNLRINPANAVLVTDTAIAGGLDLVGSAYTNNFAGAATTQLYGLDAASDQLFVSTNPNGGAYSAVGALGIDLSTTTPVGFDISGLTGAAFFNAGSQFYSVNLSTGAATLVGSIGSGSLVGLAAGPVPEPGVWTVMVMGFGCAGALIRRRRQRPALG